MRCYTSIEKRIARNTAVLKANPHSLNTLRSAVLSVRAVSSSEEEFVRQLRKQGIEAIFRRTDESRIYGATFINRTERLAVNGSRLGREFAARAWEEWCNTSHATADTILTGTPQRQAATPSDVAGETAGKLQQNVPSLLDDILITGTETFGELFEPLPPQHEEYIDPAFRIIRTKKRKKKHQIKP